MLARYAAGSAGSRFFRIAATQRGRSNPALLLYGDCKTLAQRSRQPTASMHVLSGGRVALRRTACRPGGQQPHRPDTSPNLRPPAVRWLLLRPRDQPSRELRPGKANLRQGYGLASRSRCESAVNRRRSLHFSAINAKHLVSNMLDVTLGHKVAVFSAACQVWFTLCLQFGSSCLNCYLIGDQQLEACHGCVQHAWRGLC